MIDEKKIEEAAFNTSKGLFYPHERDIMNAGFKAGINWLLDNLWHKDIYKIEINKPILIQMRGKGDFVVIKLRSNEYPCNFASRWLYVDDLLKGGK